MTNIIFHEDCLKTLQRMQDDYLDLTITSPPYNVDLKYDVHIDSKPYFDYLLWLREIFSKVYVKTKTGGRCVINIGDQKNGQISLHSDVIQMMKEIGWLTFTNIIWNKQNCKSRTAWGSFQSPSCPSFPRPFEYILIFCKESMKLNGKGKTDLSKEEFIQWSLGIWNVKPETAKIGHPAPFPIEIPLRCVKMLSYQDSIIYDPFMGSGSTAIACKKSDRKWIGSEISFEYCKIAENRLKKIFFENKNEKDLFF